MANKAGTSSGIGIGVGASGQGNTGLGAVISKQRTGVAKLTQPPQQEGGAGESAALIFIALVIFNFVGVAATWLISLISGIAFESVSVWIAGLFVGFIAAVSFGIWMWKHSGGQKTKREAAYKAALLRWQHSWLCLRCGHTFTVR